MNLFGWEAGELPKRSEIHSMQDSVGESSELISKWFKFLNNQQSLLFESLNKEKGLVKKSSILVDCDCLGKLLSYI